MNYFNSAISKLSFGFIFGAVKRVVAITFIFLLSAQCIFKLGIITFFQAHRDYIAEVLCVNKEEPMTMCYGQCFLDRNLALVDDGIPKQAKTNDKVQVETSVFVEHDIEIKLAANVLELEDVVAQQSLYKFFSLSSLFHPPC